MTNATLEYMIELLIDELEETRDALDTASNEIADLKAQLDDTSLQFVAPADIWTDGKAASRPEPQITISAKNEEYAERNSEIMRLTKLGQSAQQIADALGCTPHTVYNVRSKYNIKVND